MSGTPTLRRETPASAGEAAALLRAASAEGARVRFAGGATKLGWGRPIPEPDMLLSTAGMDQIVEHNVGDLTAILGAGVPLARAQEQFASEGQILAWDPPLGADDAATIGGVLATADSGPLRHRYHAVRDLAVGITVVLSDGTVAKAGGKVIKNVAGYDLTKLFAGAFGTLGLIAEVAVRLHPRPVATATALARSSDPDALARTASDLAHRPLELEALDLRWEDGAGMVLARFGGSTAAVQAAGALDETIEDDEAIWAAQRAAQRSDAGAVLRVSTLQTGLPAVLRAADRHRGRVVARAALGLAWLALPERDPVDLAAEVTELRAELSPAPCVVLDAPADVRGAVDPWDGDAHSPFPLLLRVKERFDPTGTCNPHLFVGGI
jgi:glycolate oxidase FAD binding subunit